MCVYNMGTMIRVVASYSTHNVVIPVENVLGAVGVGDGMLRSVEEFTWGFDAVGGTGGKNRGNECTKAAILTF